MISGKYKKTAIIIGLLNHSFKRYLTKKVLKNHDDILLEELASITDVYILSGVIRNFFLDKNQNRDLDIVVGKLTGDCIKIFEYSHYFKGIERNKFGGVKILMEYMTIDMWQISHTRGLVEKKQEALPENLINTVFFNFSAIIYDYKNSKFLFNDAFCRFFCTGLMDVVYKNNPWKEACIISALYYRDRYRLGIGNGLSKWIKKYYSLDADYITPQIRRFGEVKYTYIDIKKFVDGCGKNAEIINIDGYRRIMLIYLKNRLNLW